MIACTPNVAAIALGSKRTLIHCSAGDPTFDRRTLDDFPAQAIVFRDILSRFLYGRVVASTVRPGAVGVLSATNKVVP
jgi:hypothetical protein